MKIALEKSNYTKVENLSKNFVKVCQKLCDENKDILESLKIIRIKTKNLKNLKVLDIGTGRHSRFFAKHGAIVDHFDLSKDNVVAINK